MTAIQEIRRGRRRNRDQEMKSIIPDVTDPDFDKLNPDDMTVGMGMLKDLIDLGVQRKQELEHLVGESSRTGEYWILHAVNGEDFGEKANYEYFKEKYPWLHSSGQRIGIDETKALETHPDLEAWLAFIPHESWNEFMDDMESLANDWVSFDEDREQELKQEEEERWMKEDGWPDLVKVMRDSSDDAYEAYLLSKVPEKLVWAWCSETEHWPEIDGDSAWMDMDKFGAEPETQDWFVERMDDDEPGWKQAKLAAYNEGGMEALEKTLRGLAQQDEQIAHVYNQLDTEHLWQLFLATFPDEKRHDGDPGWYWYRPNFFYGAHNRAEGAEQEEWKPGFPVDSREAPERAWVESLNRAMDYLSGQDWWLNMVRTWTRRPPEGHPELEFGGLGEDQMGDIENEIQRRAPDKDKGFDLEGDWKEFVREQDGFKVYKVDGTWVRDNLCNYFGHGGHGLVHEFIPHDEIWISSHHYHESPDELGQCGCDLDSPDQKASQAYFDSTTLHEIEEYKKMKGGEKFSAAHHKALKKERDAGLLPDPYDDRAKARAAMEEALEQGADPDDPETFIKYGGGIEEEIVYEDDKIVVYYPRDFHAINWHLRRAGSKAQIGLEYWNDRFKHQDIFVIVGKEQPDLLGRTGQKELGIVYGDSDSGLTSYAQYSTYGNKNDLSDLLGDPVYGASIKRMLLRFYRDQGRDDAAGIFLQVGGARALRRAGRRGQVDLSSHSTRLGLYYIQQRKYKLAAKTFNRDPSTMTPKGVWLIYDDVSDLSVVFSNGQAVQQVFDHETFDWFNYTADVDDVVQFLTDEAMAHIREAMVNRRVFYPDGGPDQQGDYVVLTTELLSQLSDEEILNWIIKPNQEDLDTGVFDDIIEAFKFAGGDILDAAAVDSVYSGCVKEAVDAIGGKEHKWVNHPTKKGQDAFAVFVPWSDVKEDAEEYRAERSGQDWTESLESLALETAWKKSEFDSSRYEPSWRDVNKEYASEQLHRIFELEAPDFPDDPAQVQLPLGEAVDIDDPETFVKSMDGLPHDLLMMIRRRLDSLAEVQDFMLRDIRVSFGHDESELYRLRVSFKPEGAWIEEYGIMNWNWQFELGIFANFIATAFRGQYDLLEPVLEESEPGRVCMVFPMTPHQPEDLNVPF